MTHVTRLSMYAYIHSDDSAYQRGLLRWSESEYEIGYGRVMQVFVVSFKQISDGQIVYNDNMYHSFLEYNDQFCVVRVDSDLDSAFHYAALE